MKGRRKGTERVGGTSNIDQSKGKVLRHDPLANRAGQQADFPLSSVPPSPFFFPQTTEHNFIFINPTEISKMEKTALSV